MTVQGVINDLMNLLGGLWTLGAMHPLSLLTVIVITVILKKMHIIR